MRFAACTVYMGLLYGFIFLPVAVLAIVLAIGCHLRLRRLGSELVRPEA